MSYFHITLSILLIAYDRTGLVIVAQENDFVV